jgi:threonine synthase
VGDGVIIAGFYKGLWELRELGWIDHLPRLIAVQSAGSDALVRYLHTGRFEFRPAHTVADSISAGAPRNLYLAAKAVRESNGEAITVSDADILAAQQVLAREMGILAEPAAAAAFAGYLNWLHQEKFHSKDQPLVLITGSGLKDTAALQQWNQRPGALSPDAWRERLLK